MNIFLTQQEGSLREQFFPRHLLEKLQTFGSLEMNPYGRVMTEEELARHLAHVEVCVVLAWGGCPKFTSRVLDEARELKLIVTPGASVAPFITDAVYERGIRVCSANSVMAMYVAEGALAYMLAALREVVQRNDGMQAGEWNSAPCGSLIGASIGMVGLGTVGRYLLEFLRPFSPAVKIYDPYIRPESLRQYPYAALCSLEEALSGNDIVSLHASKTEETFHLLNGSNLPLLKDGALLINTARGALIDEEALIQELATGRIQAVLDVYEAEPLPPEHRLQGLRNVVLMPHIAGMVHLEKLTSSMLEEIARYGQGQPLLYQIPVEQYKLMTR